MDTMRAIAIVGVLAAWGGSLAVSQTPAAGGNQDSPPLSPPSTLSRRSPNRESIEILSDTQGADLTFYARREVAAPIRRNWYHLMPAEAKAPSLKQSQAVVEFSVARDGTGSNVKLAQSSGDDALDKAALDAVRQSSPFAEIPSEYQGQSVSLRVHFYYNPGPDEKFQGLTTQGFGPGLRRGANRPTPEQTMPRAVYMPDPEFSEQARRDKVEGVVVLRITVSAAGDVSDAVVVKSLGSGLDEKALEAVRRWKFTPAMKDGSPVSAEVTAEVSFQLSH